MNKKYREYLQSQQWQELRRGVFQRALQNTGSNNLHRVCEKCGYEPWKPCLQVHHKTYERVFREKLDDLILLCPKCHKKEKENRQATRTLSSHEKRNKIINF